MISGIGALSSPVLPITGNNSAQASAESTGAVGETSSPFEIAQQILDVKTNNLKRTLDAQEQILDLLV
jgi:hypothetical protein